MVCFPSTLPKPNTRRPAPGCASLWEVIEQIELGSETLLLSHVYGLGIDDEVSYRIENLATPEDYWSHRDDLNSLTSVTDASGDVKERYQYGDYGQVTILDPDTGIERTSSEFIGATHLYTGRSLITGTGLQDSRWRVLDLETGKFVQRDPLGFVDSMNVYAYARSSPIRNSDPYGLHTGPSCIGGDNDADGGTFTPPGAIPDSPWFIDYDWVADPGGRVFDEDMGTTFTSDGNGGYNKESYSWTFPATVIHMTTIEAAGRSQGGRVRKSVLFFIPWWRTKDRPGVFHWFERIEFSKGRGGLAGYPCKSKKRFKGTCTLECDDGTTRSGEYDFEKTMGGTIKVWGFGMYYCDTSGTESDIDLDAMCRSKK